MGTGFIFKREGNTVYIITNFCDHQTYSHLPTINKTHHIQVSSFTDGTQINNPDPVISA